MLRVNIIHPGPEYTQSSKSYCAKTFKMYVNVFCAPQAIHIEYPYLPLQDFTMYESRYTGANIQQHMEKCGK